jgi:hypothetical protein
VNKSHIDPEDLIYGKGSKIKDMIENLQYHQKIDKTKFVFMTNPNYVPADLDSDDEDPQEYANAKKPLGQADDLDIRRANELVVAKFEDDEEFRHMPDEVHVEKEVQKVEIGEQLEKTKTFIQDMGNSVGQSFGNIQLDKNKSVISRAETGSSHDHFHSSPSSRKINEKSTIKKKSVKDMFKEDEIRREKSSIV